MSQFTILPPAAASVNPSIGTNGAPAPTSSTEVGGIGPDGNLHALSTDNTGALNVNPSSFPGLQNINLTEVGGAAISEGQKTMANSLPVAIASDQSAIPISAAALPLPAGAATAANQTNATQKTQIVDGSGNVIASTANAINANITNFPGTQPISGTVTVVQPTGTNLHAVLDATSTTAVTQATAANLNATVVQSSGTNLHVNVDNFPATQPISGTVTVTQATGTNLHTVVDSGTITAVTAITNALPAGTNTIGAVTTATPTAGTVTQAAVTVGTTAVRATVSGSAPSATRKLLVISPDPASTATFYVGSSTVTNSGATRGPAIVAGQSFIANNDAGDYFIISSTAAQTVEIMEQ